MALSWVVVKCLADVYRRFRGACCILWSGRCALWNVGKFVADYTEKQPTRNPSYYLIKWTVILYILIRRLLDREVSWQLQGVIQQQQQNNDRFLLCLFYLVIKSWYSSDSKFSEKLFKSRFQGRSIKRAGKKNRKLTFNMRINISSNADLSTLIMFITFTFK